MQTIKYIKDKPVSAFSASTQFLSILAAEREQLVIVRVQLPTTFQQDLIDQLQKIYLSDLTSDVAKAWNELRFNALQKALDTQLFPMAAKYARERMKEDAQELCGNLCGEQLESMTEVAPYKNNRMNKGATPGVVAISHGAGDPRKDHVFVVFVDNQGRFRDHFKLDNLRRADFNPNGPPQEDCRQRLKDLLKLRRPDVVVIGGFSYRTHALHEDVKSILEEHIQDMDSVLAEEYPEQLTRAAQAELEAIYVPDSIARMFQNSKRAAEEFPDLPKLGRYCVGLARYAQSPLNEYAALGSDLTAMPFHPAQPYVSRMSSLFIIADDLS